MYNMNQIIYKLQNGSYVKKIQLKHYSFITPNVIPYIRHPLDLGCVCSYVREVDQLIYSHL